MSRGRPFGNVSRALVVLGLFFGATLTAGARTEAEETFRVHVASGRVFNATVDSRTDEEQLWLRFSGPSTVVLRPIRWDRVVRVESPSANYTSAEFRQVAEDVVLNQNRTGDGPSRLGTVGDEDDRPNTPRTSQATFATLALDSLAETAKVSSIDIDAYVANWDSDVEVDGIIVDVWPLDAHGSIVPVDGTLEVELVAQGTGVNRRQQRSQTIGRWTQNVSAERVGYSGVRYRLEFQASHPEFDLNLHSRGLVHARLVAPGHGTFDASDAMVRIRPYSSVRDHLEQREGGRFFPNERTGRTH